MVDNPATVLRSAISGQHIVSTTALHVATKDAAAPGGGTANTAFLHGAKDGPDQRVRA